MCFVCCVRLRRCLQHLLLSAHPGDCPACRGQLSLRKAGDATFVTCGAHPLCATRVVLPTACSEAAVTEQRCTSCPATVRCVHMSLCITSV